MIRVFPTKTITARLVSNDPSAWTRLRENTELRDSLMSVRTNKTFVGQVRTGYFKLISSRIGRGAFCTLEGRFTAPDGSGTIHIEVHKAFRILMIAWLLAIVGLMIWAWSIQGTSLNWVPLIQAAKLIVTLVIIRFVAIEWLFRSVTKRGMEALTPLLGLVEEKETGHSNH